jgi:ribosome-associated heat shock protein Hsp15
VGAPVVKEFAQDLTPASEYEKPKDAILRPLFPRPKGSGRPTKKERRAIGKIEDMF